MSKSYMQIAQEMIARGDIEEISEVFRLRDEATAAMVRQCCLPDSPSDYEVCVWLATIPANGGFLARALTRTGQKIVKAS